MLVSVSLVFGILAFGDYYYYQDVNYNERRLVVFCRLLEDVDALDLEACSEGLRHQVELLTTVIQRVAGAVCEVPRYCSVQRVQRCVLETVTTVQALGTHSSRQQVCRSVGVPSLCYARSVGVPPFVLLGQSGFPPCVVLGQSRLPPCSHARSVGVPSLCHARSVRVPSLCRARSVKVTSL